MSQTDERPVVIVSNRGPVSYREHHGELVGVRGAGGLISGLGPLLDSGEASWIAAALSDADRSAVSAGTATPDGVAVRLLNLDPIDQALAYDVISNQTLWFIHHGLFDLTRSPSYTQDWFAAWDAYRRVNQAFARAVCESAPSNAIVLIQDYHLTLMAPALAAERPDLSTVHFHHTPFAGPDMLRVLPPAARNEMLLALNAHDACGFHTSEWAQNFEHDLLRWPPQLDTKAPEIRSRVFASSLSPDAADLHSTARSAGCEEHLLAIEEQIGDCQLLVRIDRMELSKNILRGFQAFDLLLQQRSDLRERVVFLACCYPSRENLAEYASYKDQILQEVDRINERWGSSSWQPICLKTDDNYLRSVAALQRYDVLLVNPIRDGLNLVAKEGPLLNLRHGQLVLSTEAGAWGELQSAAFGVNPFDIEQTAQMLGMAFDLDVPDRTTRAAELAALSAERTPMDWLQDQIAAVNSLAG
ncbi:MAG: trehalose-6-phosphate synthase [Microthrixaceae bacterium]